MKTVGYSGVRENLICNICNKELIEYDKIKKIQQDMGI